MSSHFKYITGFVIGAALLIGVGVAQAASCSGVFVGGTGICYPNQPKAHTVLLGEDSGAIGTTSPSTSGYVLTSNGVSADPTFQPATGGVSYALATTSPWSGSGVAYRVDDGHVSSVATSTLTASSPLTGSLIQIGSGGSLGCQTASGSQAGCLSSTDWTTFNNKQAALSGGTAGYATYWTGASTLGKVATTSVSSGTGISFTGTAGALVGGTNLTITNSSPLSGLSASYPFSFSNPTLSWIGLATSSPIAAASGLLYATGVNTFASVSTSTAVNMSITGNAGTATALATGRTISITGDLAYTSPSFDGSGNVTAAGTLATVNSNVGSFTNANITVNAKGLITAASSGSSSTGYWATGSNNIWNINSLNVGIGTTTPSALLTLMASSTLPTENLLTLADSTGAPVFTVATSSSSLLGVGTSTPWRTLGVTGTVGFDGLTAGAGAGALCLSSNKEVVYSAGAGCTGAASGTVTSVGLSDSNSTLTIGSTPVTTSGTITATLNLAHSNTWSVKQTFSAASTTALTAASEFNAPHSGTVPTLYGGDFYINTNSTASSSLAFSDGTNTHNLFAVHSFSMVLASSTLAYDGAYGGSGTTTLLIANPIHASKMNSYFCKTDVGTVYVGFGTGSATTTETQCTSSGTNVPVSSNNTWTGRQSVYIEVGHQASTPNNITVTADVEDAN